jgi:3D-(3,5/4)-trihydroxycyclohexane-1,2-dione acylhydrolase (decyclizing)
MRTTAWRWCTCRPEGGLGAYGSWNVGNWCDDVQRRYLATVI